MLLLIKKKYYFDLFNQIYPITEQQFRHLFFKNFKAKDKSIEFTVNRNRPFSPELTKCEVPNSKMTTIDSITYHWDATQTPKASTNNTIYRSSSSSSSSNTIDLTQRVYLSAAPSHRRIKVQIKKWKKHLYSCSISLLFFIKEFHNKRIYTCLSAEVMGVRKKDT